MFGIILLLVGLILMLNVSFNLLEVFLQQQ